MNFCFKILCKMWTCLWVTYCSLFQLIVMPCGTLQVRCNMYLVLIHLKQHDLLNYTLVIQSQHIRCSQRLGWMVCFCCQLRAWPVFLPSSQWRPYPGGVPGAQSDETAQMVMVQEAFLSLHPSLVLLRVNLYINHPLWTIT